MWKYHTSNSSSAAVCQGSMEIDRSIDFQPDAKRLSVVDKSAFTDILGETACSHI